MVNIGKILAEMPERADKHGMALPPTTRDIIEAVTRAYETGFEAGQLKMMEAQTFTPEIDFAKGVQP